MVKIPSAVPKGKKAQLPPAFFGVFMAVSVGVREGRGCLLRVVRASAVKVRHSNRREREARTEDMHPKYCGKIKRDSVFTHHEHHHA